MTNETSNVSYVLKLTAVLLAITIVVAALLGGVNALTAGPISELNKQKTANAIMEVLPSEAEAEEITDFADETGLVTTLYKVGEDGYVAKIIVGGSQADIEMMVGVAADQTVSGISFIAMSETPGLGAIAAQDSTKGQQFRDQYIGLSGELAVTKDGGVVDSLTGATVTSRAVTTGVNAALACVAANS